MCFLPEDSEPYVKGDSILTASDEQISSVFRKVPTGTGYENRESQGILNIGKSGKLVLLLGKNANWFLFYFIFLKHIVLSCCK